jgi:hypothetical protein
LPLSAYAVSRHFCFLSQQVRVAGRHGADDLAAVARFLVEQDAKQAKLAEEAESYGWAEELERYQELGYRTVQFFDRVSLWLCCADEKEDQTMTAPMGETVTFSPQRAAQSHAETSSVIYRLEGSRPDFRHWRVAIEPYPLAGETHDFSLEARRIPVRVYADDEDLQATWSSAPTVRLTWTFGRA